MSALRVAPNLLNSVGPWRRLPLVETEDDALPFEGLGLFRTYVPSNLGGLLEIACDQPESQVTVSYPKPGDVLKDLADKPIAPAQRFVYPVRLGEHGWFYSAVGKVKGSYNVWARFWEIGLAREAEDDNAEPLIPWNFWYWPNAASRKEVTAWGSSVLQPCQKYEAAFGRSGVLDWEEAHHNDPDGTKEAWHGHCHNSAPAAMIFKPPPDEGLTMGGQSFSCEELKFFATEFVGRYGDVRGIWGLPGSGPLRRRGPYHENKPADKPELFGKLVGDFHQNLARELLRNYSPLLMDLRDSTGSDHAEVWNQAIYKYVAQFYETTPHGDWKDIQVTTWLHANEDTLPAGFKSSGLPAQVVARGPRAEGKPKDAVPAPSPPAIRRDQVLCYQLIFKDGGAVDTKNPKNRWSSNTFRGTELFAPRFMFVPHKVRATPDPEGDGNPRIERDDVLKMWELWDRYK